MAGPWEQYQSAPSAAPTKGPWTQFGQNPQPDDNKGMWGAIETGINSALLGYGPEVAAAQGMIAGAPNPFVSEKSNAMLQQGRDPDPNVQFQKDVLQGRQEIQQYGKDSPWSSAGAGLLGSLATAPAIGAGFGAMGLGAKAVNAAAPLASRLSGYASNIAKGAGIGGLLGVAANPNQNSTSMDYGQIDQRLAQGTAGAVVGGALPAAGAAVKEGTQLAGATGRGLLRMVTGVPASVTKEYMENYPSVQRTAQQAAANPEAMPLDRIASDVSESMGTLETQRNAASQISKDILEQSNIKLPRQPVDALIDKEIAGYMVDGKPPVGETAQAAVTRLTNLKQSLAQYGDFVTGPGAKQIVQQLSDDIEWGKANAPRSVNSALQRIDGGLNGMLKEAVPNYKAVMDSEVAPKTALLERLKDLHYDDPNKGAGLLKNVTGKIGKTEQNQLLQDLGNQTGKDFVGDIKNTALLAEFKKERPQATRNVLLGVISGLAAGAKSGGDITQILGAGAISGVATKKLEQSGGPITKGLIDAYMKTQNMPTGLPPTAEDAIRNYLATKQGAAAGLAKKATGLLRNNP